MEAAWESFGKSKTIVCAHVERFPYTLTTDTHTQNLLYVHNEGFFKKKIVSSCTCTHTHTHSHTHTHTLFISISVSSSSDGGRNCSRGRGFQGFGMCVSFFPTPFLTERDTVSQVSTCSSLPHSSLIHCDFNNEVTVFLQKLTPPWAWGATLLSRTPAYGVLHAASCDTWDETEQSAQGASGNGGNDTEAQWTNDA